MKKVIGAVLVLAGIIVFALSFAYVRTLTSITVPGGLSDMVLSIVGGLLFIVGLVFFASRQGRTKQMAEVPIYHNGAIVGYRRLK